MKNKFYFRIILPVVILIILVFLLFLFRNRSPFGKGQSSFASEPKSEITSFELTCDNQRVLLSIHDGIWKVNRESEARRSVILFMLRVLKEMRIKSPVSPEMFDSEVVSKGILPVRVKVYEKRKLLSSFYVYRTATNRYGNIMKTREKSRPFIVHFPGFEGEIGSIFNPNELFWHTYNLFNLLPSEISAITLDDDADTSSFTIKITGKTYRLSDMNKDLTGWDPARVKRYISYFTLVPFEGWAFDLTESEKYAIQSSNPVYRISVERTDGKTVNLSLWERIIDGKKDTGRLWGKTDSSEEIFIIRYFDIDPLLRKLSYFFPEQ